MQHPDDNSGDSVLVLIPAYNEALRIEPVIAEARKHLPVAVIDDGSSDNTSQVAERAGAQVLSLQPNQGKGAALKAGFKHAIQQGFKAALTLDADGQHDPVEIPEFIHAFKERHADLIVGARDFKDMPPVRRLANWLGKRSFSWAMGRTIPDNQSGYRLISRRLMQEMLDSQQEGFEFEVEMIVTCVQRGYDLDWVNIRTIYAGESSHINPLKHLVNYVRLVVKTRHSVRNPDG
ncbi:MAG: glycosyltransferase family 2 protein [Candidatus Promineifilaceae bacterium]